MDFPMTLEDDLNSEAGSAESNVERGDFAQPPSQSEPSSNIFWLNLIEGNRGTVSHPPPASSQVVLETTSLPPAPVRRKAKDPSVDLPPPVIRRKNERPSSSMIFSGTSGNRGIPTTLPPVPTRRPLNIQPLPPVSNEDSHRSPPDKAIIGNDLPPPIRRIMSHVDLPLVDLPLPVKRLVNEEITANSLPPPIQRRSMDMDANCHASLRPLERHAIDNLFSGDYVPPMIRHNQDDYHFSGSSLPPPVNRRLDHHEASGGYPRLESATRSPVHLPAVDQELFAGDGLPLPIQRRAVPKFHSSSYLPATGSSGDPTELPPPIVRTKPLQQREVKPHVASPPPSPGKSLPAPLPPGSKDLPHVPLRQFPPPTDQTLTLNLSKGEGTHGRVPDLSGPGQPPAVVFDTPQFQSHAVPPPAMEWRFKVFFSPVQMLPADFYLISQQPMNSLVPIQPYVFKAVSLCHI